MRSKFALLLTVSALAAVPTADAKVIPTLSARVAAPGQRVVVNFGDGAMLYLGPFEVDLVRTAVEPRVTRRADVRLHPVGRLEKTGVPIATTRLGFRVPQLPGGEYTLAVWFKRSELGRCTT